MTTSLLAIMWDATLALTMSALAMLAIRPMLRARLGAEHAYAAWLAVPLATATTLLPALPAATPLAGAIPSMPGVSVLAAEHVESVAWVVVALVVWIVGAVAAFVVLAAQQRRFVRALALAAPSGHADGVPLRRAHGPNATPATIGALRPIIVLPADFEQRYDAGERALVLAHEQVHIARRDGLANAVLAALRCLFWFDPVVHWAARRFRFDQELACDAAVLRRHPGAQRAYAEAIFKTQLAVPGLPVGCTWQSSQHLKERILMLKKNRATRSRIGGVATALVVGVLACSTYASQADAPAAHQNPAPEVAPTFAKLVSVAYPKAALDGKLEGDVVVKVHIGADGTVLEAAPDSDLPQPAQVLQDAAVAGIRQWTFNPARDAGRAVDTWVRVPVSFRFDDDSAPVPDGGSFDAIRVMPEAPGT